MKYNAVYLTIMTMILNVTLSMEEREGGMIERKSVWGSMKEGSTELIGLTKNKPLQFIAGTTVGGLGGFALSEGIFYTNKKISEPLECIQEHKKEITIITSLLGLFAGFGVTAMIYGKEEGKKQEVLKNIKEYKMQLEEIERRPDDDVKTELKAIFEQYLAKANYDYNLL
jgi:hypothetical protein